MAWRAAIAWLILMACAPWSAAHAQSVAWIRVCADPDDLPYSNQAMEGFENQIMALIARDLEAQLTYEWRPRARGFVQQTLLANACDVVPGVVAGRAGVATSEPYYRSIYMFMSRTDRGVRTSSLNDPALANLRIATPDLIDDRIFDVTRTALARRNITTRVSAHDMRSRGGAPPPIVEALLNDQADVAMVWGPTAGFFASRAPARMTITPVEPYFDPPAWPMAFDIAMAVRPGDRRLQRALNASLRRNDERIRVILRAYGVPLVTMRDEGR